MNIYDKPFPASQLQTIIPVMNEAGEVYGWYNGAPIAYTGVPASLNLPGGLTFNMRSVHIDKNPTEPGKPWYYMAIVYPLGLPKLLRPWVSEYFIPNNDGMYRAWCLPTMTHILRDVQGALLTALRTGMKISGGGAVTPPGPPVVTTPATLHWQASVAFSRISGDCLFFDFNWVTLFKAQSDADPIRIVPQGVPVHLPSTPAGDVLVSQVLGIPVATPEGLLFNTIRVLKLEDHVAVGQYEFQYKVFDTLGQSTDVVFTLTVQ